MYKCRICKKNIVQNETYYQHEYPFEKPNKRIQYAHVWCEKKVNEERNTMLEMVESEADWDE